MHFSAQALSAVFTSDKLLLTVLINVLHPNVEKVVNLDSSSAETVKTNGHCSVANKQYISEAAGKLWRQKSATLPAKHKHDSCMSRRLSEPLIKSLEQRQASVTVNNENISDIDRTHDHSSAVVENSQIVGATSKLFGSRNSPVWLSSTVPSQVCVATTVCSKEPLVVNSIYGSDDCSTLKSLSFEKNDTCLREPASVLSRVLYVPKNKENDSISEYRMPSSSTEEENCRTIPAVTSAFSDCVMEENFTFLEVPASDFDLSTSRQCYRDVSCLPHVNDGEVDGVCTQFQYRKVCIYLQEGTWRHSPHSLHCIRIDNNISLVVLCEVMLLLLMILCLMLILFSLQYIIKQVL